MTIEKNVKLCAKSCVNKVGKEYYKLYVDLGYTEKVLSFNVGDIAEILGVSVVELIGKLKETK